MTDLIRYVDTLSVGGDGTSQAHSGANAAYASLASWEAAEQTDLVTDTDTMTVLCAGAADVSNTLIQGWTTGVSNTITVGGDPTAPGGDGINTGDAFSTSFYYNHNNHSDAEGIYVLEDYVTIENLQFLMEGTTNSSKSLYFAFLSAANQCYVRKCRYKHGTSASVNHSAIHIQDADANVDIETCSVEWDDDAFNECIFIQLCSTVNIFNCVIEGAFKGIEIATGYLATIKNCSVFNCTDDINDIDGNSTIDFCATDDGDGTNAQDMSPGGTESDGWNDAVTSFSTGDYTPKNSLSVLTNNGTATGAPSTDLLGNGWNGSHEIGSFAFSPGGVAVGNNLGSAMGIRMGIGV